MEVFGHDHFADLRYHSSNGVLDIPEPESKFDFHNMFVAPGVTPEKGNNPGVSMFEVSDTGIPSNLKMEFIDLKNFSGATSLSYDDLNFLSFDLATDFGFSDLSPQGLVDLRKYLEDSDNYDSALDYLVQKLGYDPKDSDEFD